MPILPVNGAIDTCLASILVVDDEATNVRLLEKMWEQVTWGLDAIYANPFDLILLDINMPHLDGFEVMEQLKQQTGLSIPPILVLTAQQANEYRLRALQSGASDYLTKPFNRTELLARVRNLIEVQLAHKYMREQNALRSCTTPACRSSSAWVGRRNTATTKPACISSA